MARNETEGRTGRSGMNCKVERKGLSTYLRSEDAGGLHFRDDIIREIVFAAENSSIVLLYGPSGTGKSSLAAAYAGYATASAGSGRFRQVSVQAEWDGSADLLGRFDPMDGRYSVTPFLDVLLRALREPDAQHFVILESIDRAPVERYLGRFLECLQSPWPLGLHERGSCVPEVFASREDCNLVCHDDCSACFFSNPSARPGRLPSVMEHFVPPMIRIPDNLTVIATCTVQRPILPLPSRLLDRCSAVYLGDVDLEGFLDGPGAPLASGVAITADFLRSLGRLQQTRRHVLVSYRGARDCLDFVSGHVRGQGVTEREVLDIAVAQRLLPAMVVQAREFDESKPLEDGGAKRRAFNGTGGSRAELVRLFEKFGLSRSLTLFQGVGAGDAV